MIYSNESPFAEHIGGRSPVKYCKAYRQQYSYARYAPQPGDNEARLLRGAAAVSSGKRLSSRCALLSNHTLWGHIFFPLFAVREGGFAHVSRDFFLVSRAETALGARPRRFFPGQPCAEGPWRTRKSREERKSVLIHASARPGE